MTPARTAPWNAALDRRNAARLLVVLLFVGAAYRMMLALQFLVGPVNFPGRYPGIEGRPLASALWYGALAAGLAIAFDRLGRSRRDAAAHASAQRDC